MQGLQRILLRHLRGLFLLVAAVTVAGCPHLNTGLPPSLQLPLLQQNSPASGSYHVVARDETLWGIATTYRVDLQALAEVNNLKPPYTLNPGAKLFIPGAAGPKLVERSSPAVMDEPTVEDFSGLLAWPVRGMIVSEFGVRGGTQYNGIGIKAEEGTSVRAAASGRVGYVGSIPLYGNVVLIEHPNRLVTVYGHLKDIRVENSKVVERNEVIGTVGTSGRANAPLLYFEVRSRSKPRNPRFFLDQKA